MGYLGLEKVIMTRFNSSNGFTFSQKVNSKMSSNGVRKIHRGKCSGYSQKTSSLCDIVPLWTRICGNLVLYLSTGIDTTTMLDIRHSSNCIRSRRSIVPFEIIQQAVRIPHHKNKARRAIQTFAKSDDATINESLLRNGINIQSESGLKILNRAIGNRVQSEKTRQKTVIACSRKPSSFSDIRKIKEDNSMSIDEFCKHASNETFILANSEKIVVLADDLDSNPDKRSSGFVFTTIGRLFILNKVIEMYEWKKRNHLGKSAITGQIDGLVVFKPNSLKAVHIAFSDFLHQTFVVFFAVS
jgi:hypothetical protein